MPASGWIRKWKSTQATSDPLSSLIRAATRGERIEQLLELGARALLAAGDADRAGLWVAGNRRGETGQGSVMELKPGPIPIEWKRLDVSTPFLRAALDSPEPMRVELGSNQAMSHLGPLVGMRSAIWIPLRTRNCTFGLAMVAYSGVTGNAEMEMLRLRADEISLAVQQHRDSLRAELAAEETSCAVAPVSSDSVRRFGGFHTPADCAGSPPSPPGRIRGRGAGKRSADIGRRLRRAGRVGFGHSPGTAGCPLA